MTTLADRLTKAIDTVAQFANLLPCVTIIHEISDGSVVWMCNRGLKELDISLTELIALGKDEYYNRFFNPKDAEDYVPKILGLLERNNDEENVSYLQQVRRNHQNTWTWHMSCTKIFLRDEHNKPVLLITQSMPIDPKHTISIKAGKILEENNFLRANITKFSRLSNRELEVLKHLAKGESSAECANHLFISSQTVDTHRKNIRKKLGTSSFAELVKYARSFDLI